MPLLTPRFEMDKYSKYTAAPPLNPLRIKKGVLLNTNFIFLVIAKIDRIPTPTANLKKVILVVFTSGMVLTKLAMTEKDKTAKSIYKFPLRLGEIIRIENKL